ncbi:hypothetical protein BLA29_005237 [Euroglyphus maynei]|uniref:Uncharacterized protein n=1 Tax=Euroglyphus maynei TaxID=6958 RepID=A0A1Y3B0M8_EURMA|nr:hypothetical protein BLA29_005237 [Euroglyphus maynei]
MEYHHQHQHNHHSLNKQPVFHTNVDDCDERKLSTTNLKTCRRNLTLLAESFVDKHPKFEVQTILDDNNHKMVETIHPV